MQSRTLVFTCFSASLLILAACVNPNAPRQTSVLIDYDDGIPDNKVHDASVRNGGFEETVSGIAVQKQVDKKTQGKKGKKKEGVVPLSYRDILSWTNLTGNSGDPVVNAGFAHQGDRSAMFGAPNDRPKESTPGQGTGYMIKSKDIFSLSAWYATSGKGTDASDYGQAVLYALDGENEIEVGRFDMKNAVESFTECTGSTAPISFRSKAVGKELHIKFVYVDADGNQKGRIRLDAVSLSVASL